MPIMHLFWMIGVWGAFSQLSYGSLPPTSKVNGVSFVGNPPRRSEVQLSSELVGGEARCPRRGLHTRTEIRFLLRFCGAAVIKEKSPDYDSELLTLPM